MNADSLEVGATYFRITYADIDCTMPSVEPLVYAGTNLFGQPLEGEDQYYFQDPVSVIRFGLGERLTQSGSSNIDASGLDFEDGADCYYSAHEARKIGEVIIDLPTLASEIDSVIERAKALGYPKLAKAKGTWV